MNFYPLQFTPILKERIWGGSKLKTVLHKMAVSDNIGESWELSTVANDISIVTNGAFTGKNLNQLIELYPNEILGDKVHKRFGYQFPLLFKFLDAQLDLSIQVHPNDILAQKRHGTFGKTEMWYVLQADDAAKLIVGFENDCTEQEYVNAIETNTIPHLLSNKKVQQGDVFFINTGTIHAIGAGTLIAEIQQTSDITYRIFDFNRVDNDGKTRELHTELALEAINYKKTETQVKYSKKVDASNRLVDCPYFTTNVIELKNEMQIATTPHSFKVYMCVEGSFSLILNGEQYNYQKGDTFLVPALLNCYTFSGIATILEIYIS